MSAEVSGHIIPPENFHPVAESYRRMVFLLNLNPVLWADVISECRVVESGLKEISLEEGRAYSEAVVLVLGVSDGAMWGSFDVKERKAAARKTFELATKAVGRCVVGNLEKAGASLLDYGLSAKYLKEARRIWASFEHEVRATDPSGFLRVGGYWLELSSALGNPGVLGIGEVKPDGESFRRAASSVAMYIDGSFAYGDGESFVDGLAPLPVGSATFVGGAVPPKLPPGHDINKQIPRPRQVLNMAARGVDEGETVLIALGDMAFDSAFVFGEPARSLSLSCNTCHNKGVTNPLFFIPGLSSVPGTVDVSNAFFGPHGNNGLFDPLDIPDLRGIRFTAPYGRNGRFASLREFIRNVVCNEFSGEEPDPLLLDAMLAYMIEFDFLPNPYLTSEGTLSDEASAQAKRGEVLFHKPFVQMGNMSCATCHVPSDFYLDRKRHDVGSVKGAGAYSLDRALDTPTLLNTKYSPPYFHDGSQPTLRSVVVWFDARYGLGLDVNEVDDLTAFVELVGEGVDAYEDSRYYLDAELEEFSFFLSTYEYLKGAKKGALIDLTFETVASELRNHKWELQNLDFLPIMDRLAALVDEAREANSRGAVREVDEKVEEYRALYAKHVGDLK